MCNSITISMQMISNTKYVPDWELVSKVVVIICFHNPAFHFMYFNGFTFLSVSNCVVRTSYLTRALLIKVGKSISCLQSATVAIAVLTQWVAAERRGSALSTATCVTTCALVTIITCHALAIWPRACAGAWITPLKKESREKMMT